MAEPALAARLAAADGADAFAAASAHIAHAHGLPLDQATTDAFARRDALGLARFTAPLLNGRDWPPPQWLPIQIAADGATMVVDWAYFGRAALTDSFFEESIRRALSQPFGRLFRYRMTFDDFLRGAESAGSREPDGLIFHMSRCGSTLAAQMLAAMPDSIVISEAAPLDSVVQLARVRPDLAAEQHALMLRAIVAAYGRRRAGSERHYVIKLDSWHSLTLPLFRRALPDVPWVFLYREPIEVLVSQMRQPGTQMVPSFVHPALYGLSERDTLPVDQYHARVLARICDAALAQIGNGARLINYRELPDAVFTRLLPHFGIAADESARAAMRRAAQRDAKAPYLEFARDSEAKQREASAALRKLSAQHLDGVYRALEAARGSA